VFGPIAVRAVRFLGLMIFLFAAIQLVMPTLMVLGLTFDNGEDRRALTIAVNSMQVVLLLIGAIILIIGQILTQATDIALENEQFV
jgi:heme/copper-type cytochrome/quinol oxidase subunit 4